MSFYDNGDSVRLSEKMSADIEKEDTLYRDGYHDDVARLVHSPSYRRLVRKRQLLPSDNSDFVRNRLTHSNEVAQIATSIGNHLNRQIQDDRKELGVSANYLRPFKINPDILIFAGLAHDIGHPPFGHLGEVALNAKMLDSGGFEGNAQTLRIVTKLERRLTSHDGYGTTDDLEEQRSPYGLNLTFRSIASILKYNTPIPIRGFDFLRLKRKERREAAELRQERIEELRGEILATDIQRGDSRYAEILGEIDALSDWADDGEHPEPTVQKGYYEEDRDIVEKTQQYVFGRSMLLDENVQSIECQIMDLADDVAYSIYDLEDCLKTGIVRPTTLLALQTSLLEEIAGEVAKKILKSHNRKKVSDTHGKKLEIDDLKGFITARVVHQYISDMFIVLLDEEKDDESADIEEELPQAKSRAFAEMLRALEWLTNDGGIRRKMTQFHISRCCSKAEIHVNREMPAASELRYPLSTHLRIEILKRLNFHLVIDSDLIQADEHRGEEIVSAVFDGLYLPCDEFKLRSRDMTGYHLLPDDVRKRLDAVYEKTAFEMLEIRQTLSQSDSFIDDIIRKHPRMRAFSLKRMLGFREYEFRYSLAISLYEEFLRDGNSYSEKHDVLKRRRAEIKRIVCDFIAGMTDRGLAEFYGRLKFEDKRVVLDEFGI